MKRKGSGAGGGTGRISACRLCARRCGADRRHYPGRCGETDEIRVARAALHMWEEPCISGKEGSGAVFFEGCPLGCVFCQNREIALGRVRGGSGAKAVSIRRLSEIFLGLETKGANNINLVTPTHYVPQIAEAVRLARASGLTIPVVYNTGSYETRETVRMLDGVAEVFLPDLKFMDPELSARLAAAPDYFETAAAAIEEMVRITGGENVFDDRGIMRRGVIVRHMVLPGHTKDSKAVIRYLHEKYGDSVFLSIMNQYTPMPGIEEHDPELARPVTRREYDRVVDYAIDIGVTNAFIQEGPTVSQSFIPSFRGEGV